MKSIRSLFLLSALLCTANTFAQTTDSTAAAPAVNTAAIPTLRPSMNGSWEKRHNSFVAIANKGGIDLLFMGDSITDFWRNRATNVWNKFYTPRHAANFGISGDRTEHVLWRIDNGELDGIHPKVLVLMIGTNNTGKDKNGNLINSPPQIADGITSIVKDIRTRLPDTKILLLGIFPRGTNSYDLKRIAGAEVNTVISKLDDGKMVKYLDIGPKFLQADGILSQSVMPDHLHPNAKGYQIWADAMEPTLAGMMN